MPAVFLPARMPLTRALVCVAVLLLVEGRGFGSPPPAGGDNNRLYERTGLEEDSPGRSCGELMSMGMTDSGVYWLLPDGYVEPFQVCVLGNRAWEELLGIRCAGRRGWVGQREGRTHLVLLRQVMFVAKDECGSPLISASRKAAHLGSVAASTLC